MVRVYNVGLHNVGMIAGEDLSSYQYHLVESGGSTNEGYCYLADSGSTTYGPIGVLQNAPESGEEATVCMFGPTKVEAPAPGTQIGIGNFVTCNGSGQATYTTTASLACGWALSTGDSSASSIIHIWFDPSICGLTKRAVH